MSRRDEAIVKLKQAKSLLACAHNIFDKNGDVANANYKLLEGLELLESEPTEFFDLELAKKALLEREKMLDEIDRLTAENEKLKEVIELQKEYIKLLGDELDSVVGIAYVHGWRSTRFEEGKRLRERIEQALKGSGE